MMKRGFRILLIVFLLAIMLSSIAFAQRRTINIKLNEFDDVLGDTLFKWYEANEVTEEVDGRVKTKYEFSDSYKTQRMIIDIIIFFAIFAGMIYFALNKWIGDKSKGALAAITIGLGFGMALALVTQTKYGSITVFFPFARNLITIAFAALLFFLLDKIIKNKFWSIIAAIILTYLAFGGMAILMCDPGEECGINSWFTKSGKDTVDAFSSCEDLEVEAIGFLAGAAEHRENAFDFAADKDPDQARAEIAKAEVSINKAEEYAKKMSLKECDEGIVNKLIEDITIEKAAIAAARSSIGGEGGEDPNDLIYLTRFTTGEDRCDEYIKRLALGDPEEWACRDSNDWDCERVSIYDQHGIHICPDSNYCSLFSTCVNRKTGEQEVVDEGGEVVTKIGDCTDIFASYQKFAPTSQSEKAQTFWNNFKASCGGDPEFNMYEAWAKELNPTLS